MERLTFTDEEMERIGTDCPVKNDYLTDRFCDNVCDEFQHNCPFMKMAQKLKAYEDKPKPNDRVYVISCGNIFPKDIIRIEISAEGIEYICFGFSFLDSEIGKTVLLTETEAEEALARMKGE